MRRVEVHGWLGLAVMVHASSAAGAAPACTDLRWSQLLLLSSFLRVCVSGGMAAADVQRCMGCGVYAHHCLLPLSACCMRSNPQSEALAWLISL